MHRSAFHVLVDLLEMIKPLDLPIEHRALLHLANLLFLLGNPLGQDRAIEVFLRVGQISEHGELAVGRHLGKAAEHDHALRLSADMNDHDPGPQRRHDRRMTGEHAEIAFAARHVDLIDFTGAESEIKVLEERNGQPVEFDAWRWEPLANVASLVVPFRREIYRAVAREFARFARSS